MEFSYDLKIPRDRIAVLIGKDGATKKDLEAETESHIDIDSKEGDIVVSGDEAIKLYSARNIIKAIGRGFNPDIALLLLKTDYAFEMINILDYVKNKNHLERVKGRLIGTRGKTRTIIEELTECNICVYGKTAGIIGVAENIPSAKKAIEMILDGAPHASVYKWLEKNRRIMTMRELEGEKIEFKEDL